MIDFTVKELTDMAEALNLAAIHTEDEALSRVRGVMASNIGFIASLKAKEKQEPAAR